MGEVLAILAFAFILFCIALDGWRRNGKISYRDVNVGLATDGWAELMARRSYRGKRVVDTGPFWARCVECGYEWPRHDTRQAVYERTTYVDPTGTLHAPGQMLKAVSSLPDEQQIHVLAKNVSLEWHRCQAGDWMVTDADLQR